MKNRSLILVGDLHGAWEILRLILAESGDTPIIQVGDFGVGFGYGYGLNRETHLWEQIENQDPKELPKNFRFIRGNHDNPAACRAYPNYMGDYGVDKETDIFFLSGAWSIDANIRKIDVNWWADEELSYEELHKAIELYEQTKPKIVITHTCPATIGKMLTNPNFGGYHGSRTENALETMWNLHRPKYWFFGHWHREWNKNILGTIFECLNSNQVKLIKKLEKLSK